MQRKAQFPILKVTLNVYEEDWEKLKILHPKLGPSRVTRELIRAHIRRIEEKQNQSSLSQIDLDNSI